MQGSGVLCEPQVSTNIGVPGVANLSNSLPYLALTLAQARLATNAEAGGGHHEVRCGRDQLVNSYSKFIHIWLGQSPELPKVLN